MGKIKNKVNALLEKIKDDADKTSLVRDMFDSCATILLTHTVVNMEK